MTRKVVVVVGPGQIGQAIARRVGVGKHVLLADRSEANAKAAADVLANAGYDVSTATVDVSSRHAVEKLAKDASRLGSVEGLVHAAGVSPSQAPIEAILKVDLYGTAILLEVFGSVVAEGGSGVVIASQSGHRLPPLPVEQSKALATTPVEELLQLDFLQPEGRLVLRIHEAKGVNAEPFHHAVAARDGAVGHDPHHHVEAFRRERDEIPERVVRGLCLRKLAVGLGLRRMDEIGKLDQGSGEEQPPVSHRDSSGPRRGRRGCALLHAAPGDGLRRGV